MKIFAKIISYLLHPLLIPLVGVLIIYNSGLYLPFSHTKAIALLLLVLGISTVLIPLSLIPFFLYQKIISSIEMKDNRERIVPLLFTTIIYYVTYLLLLRLNVTSIIPGFLLAIACTLVVTTIVTYYIKISMHMAGIGGLAGLLVYISLEYYINIIIFLLPVIVLSGILGTVRLILNAHKHSEIYLGWFIGFIGILIVMVIYL